jgi:hypothetical protein
MDPFIEGQARDDFRAHWIIEFADTLIPRVRPRYIVRVEERAYVEHHLPIPERVRETFLVVHERATMEVITVIEVLSLGNKRAGSDGQREYLYKREAILQSAAHLVELDLLRGGQRLPTIEPLPPADYFAFVCRAYDRPEAQVYAWTLRQSMPTIPIPLERGDADVRLDLQNVFTRVYDRAGYDYSLDNHHPIQPALDNADAAWVAAQLPS